MACLSARFAYGVPVDADGLTRVDGAERWLRERGFAQLRVRVHGVITSYSIHYTKLYEHRESEVTIAEREALARGQVASFHGLEATVLEVAEKMTHQHHSIADGEIATIRNALGEAATVALITGIALFDANCRLKLTFEVDVRTAVVDAPATAAGPIY